MNQDEDGGERRAARLATLAGMARPVQHELNNLLTVVFANLELLKRTAAEGPPQRQLDRIHQAARRLEVSTRAILSLTRRPVPDPVTMMPAEALNAVAPLLSVLLPNPGALTLSLPEEHWPAAFDRAAFDEAMLLLVREAAAGLPRGGSLGLAVANAEGPPAEVTLTIAWPEGAPPPSAALRAALEKAGRLSQAGETGLALGWPRARPG